VRISPWFILVCSPLLAQTAPEAPAVAPVSRHELLRGLREKKAQEIRPAQRTGFENALYEFRDKRVMERFAAGWNGLHPKVGGLHTGSGFSSGLEFRKERVGGGLLDIRVATLLSIKRYQKYDFQISLPRLLNQRLFLDFSATHRNYPQEDFFGLGPRSRKQDRSNFRMEDTSFIGTVGVRWQRWFSTGFRGGIITTNTGPGTDGLYPSIERVFTTANTPGLEIQPDFYQFGAFAQVDYRDEPGNPRSGGNYVLAWNYFGDRNKSLYAFRRHEAEIQQYIPFFNRRRVIAFRARTSLTDTSPGHGVPFYMQQTLGGSEDLRGFREFRFRDRNLVVYNLEYRWEVFSGMDMALFGDAGKVFPDRSDFSLSNLEGAYGIGLRFNQAKAVFLRIDIGRSREGTRFFFKFGHVF
jgi:outer membrane protein assembly factor BamA